eukprot:3992336-Amphidinium_carterae.1
MEALFSKYGEVENIKIGEAKRIVAGKQVMQVSVTQSRGKPNPIDTVSARGLLNMRPTGLPCVSPR